MKLAEYLADYMRTEFERQECDDIFSSEIIQQGIEAFESTEQVEVRIIDAADGKMLWRE